MQKFFKKNKGLIISSILFSLILVSALIAVKGRQIFTPSASGGERICQACDALDEQRKEICRRKYNCNRDSESIQVQVQIRGAVALENTDALGSNRFTKQVCPGKPFKTDPNINVANPNLGSALWDCKDPNFYFSQNKTSKGATTFTLIPPSGYSCARAYYYLNDKPIGNQQSGCVLNVDISTPGRYFLWFIVK